MLKIFSLLACFAAVVSAYVPFELPKELFADVNKGAPFDVNIVADRAAFLQSPVVAGLESKLKSLHPAESMAMIHATLADALQAAAIAEKLPAEDVMCTKSYVGCPAGWASLGDDCLAPINYAGSCGRSVSFSGLSPVEKASLSARCDAAFPCV